MKFLIKLLLITTLTIHTVPSVAMYGDNVQLVLVQPKKEAFIVGLSASLLLGIITGICSGTLNKVTYEECHKRGYKKTSFFMCWILNPLSKATGIAAMAIYAQRLGTPCDANLISIIATTLDWLIYFDKIKAPFYRDTLTKKDKQRIKHPLPAMLEEA